MSPTSRASRAGLDFRIRLSFLCDASRRRPLFNNAERNTVTTRHASTNASSALHFYQNRQLELYAAKETKRLTLRQLVSLNLGYVLCDLFQRLRCSLGAP